jgi:GH24 family phage-related lysozyme (muramidase)
MANMPNTQSLGRRWEAYRPSKSGWFWSCAGCIVATIVVGFTWGGWVMGSTAERMASDAADGARAQLAAMACVARFNLGPDAVDQLAALKKAPSYQRGDMIIKSGWATMPGSTDPVRGAADICVEKLMNANLKTAATSN